MMSTFLSYSRADSGLAIRLAKDLKSAGFDVWLDQLDIPTGTRWDDEVEKALESCKTFMIVLSPESLQSQNVKDEIGYAIDSGKEILPLKIKSGDIPFRLRRFQYVDFSKQSYQESLKEIKSLLSAAGSPLVSGERKNESFEAKTPSTLNKIRPVKLAPISHETKPAVKKPKPTRSPRVQSSYFIVLMVIALAILAIAGITLRAFSSDRLSAAMTPSEASVAESRPTEQSTTQPASKTKEISPLVQTGQSDSFLTKFFETKDLENWEAFILGKGKQNKVTVTSSNHGLMFRLHDADLHAYYIYKPGTYTDVIIRVKAENLGQNSHRVSLICRRTDDTWYEYTVIGGGLWQFYEYSATYIPWTNGGTHALNAGNAVNEYEMRCIGNEMTLRINGQQVAAYEIRKNVYTQGQVGFSIATGTTVFPIDINVMEFEVSKR